MLYAGITRCSTTFVPRLRSGLYADTASDTHGAVPFAFKGITLGGTHFSVICSPESVSYPKTARNRLRTNKELVVATKR